MGGVNQTYDDEFLKSRFKLFEEFMLPSVKNQTCQQFEWLVLFSDSTPEYYRKKIADYQKEYINFNPVFIDDSQHCLVHDVIAECLKNCQASYIVTTRCDNDDVLNRAFIETIQNQIINMKNNDEVIISYPYGYQLDRRTGVMRKYYFPTNHFTTLVSANKERNVYDFKHMDVLDNIKVEMIQTSPMWIEVIHDGNVYNTMGSLRFSDYIKEYDLQEDFGLTIAKHFSETYLFGMYLRFLIHKLYTKRDRIWVYLSRQARIAKRIRNNQ